ncbi:MAG TPA: hypothetical protein VNK91_14345 [Burkholderiaceae bacterium]|jgi:hypothetical protein|nr:hypothetical protein [Burkholderiaceae bacterium]
MKAVSIALGAVAALWFVSVGATEPGRKPEVKQTKSDAEPTPTPATRQRPNPAAATAGGNATRLQTRPLPPQPTTPPAVAPPDHKKGGIKKGN